VTGDVASVEALAAQAKGYPPLDLAETAGLLADVRQHGPGPAHQRLVEHNLEIAFEAARARANRGIDLGDLYQEATLAVTAALLEYASRSGRPDELETFIRRVAGTHLDERLEAAALEQESEEAFVRDAQLYETAEVALRRRFGRAVTPTEIAAILDWPPERVEVVGRMLSAARDNYDSDIARYLDDVEEPD